MQTKKRNNVNLQPALNCWPDHRTSNKPSNGYYRSFPCENVQQISLAYLRLWNWIKSNLSSIRGPLKREAVFIHFPSFNSADNENLFVSDILYCLLFISVKSSWHTLGWNFINDHISYSSHQMLQTTCRLCEEAKRKKKKKKKRGKQRKVRL